MAKDDIQVVFTADAVMVRTGFVDRSGKVAFTVGEHQLINIAPLVVVSDAEYEVTVRIKGDGKKGTNEPQASQDEERYQFD